MGVLSVSEGVNVQRAIAWTIFVAGMGSFKA
jgi:hypothetical protein